ncbi:MAG: NUDIX hydrolase [Chloroflexota bacterium]|jgi:ADP-ribose pyrophosphatase YjhB (NUDIX family)
MTYCMQCGSSMVEKVPPGDDRPRMVCPSCGNIAYINPKLVVGTLPIVDGKVLLLRRGIEPRQGTWTYPGGFLEMGETTEEGARRETREEAGIEVGHLKLHGIYNRPSHGVVTIVYLAEILNGKPKPSSETLEVAFFGPNEIPWDELAFPTTVSALKDWVSTTR